jgi:hypothetical protein
MGVGFGSILLPLSSVQDYWSVGALAIADFRLQNADLRFLLKLEKTRTSAQNLSILTLNKKSTT